MTHELVAVFNYLYKIGLLGRVSIQWNQYWFSMKISQTTTRRHPREESEVREFSRKILNRLCCKEVSCIHEIYNENMTCKWGSVHE